jgi:hypothetical protein
MVIYLTIGNIFLLIGSWRLYVLYIDLCSCIVDIYAAEPWYLDTLSYPLPWLVTGDEDLELCQDITNVSQISSEEQKFWRGPDQLPEEPS